MSSPTPPHDHTGEVGVNPFLPPLRHTWNNLVDIKWRAPFLPQVIQVIVGCLILLILFVLLCTIGEITRISTWFEGLIWDALEQIRNSKKFEEKTGYGIAIGVLHGLCR